MWFGLTNGPDTRPTYRRLVAAYPPNAGATRPQRATSTPPPSTVSSRGPNTVPRASLPSRAFRHGNPAITAKVPMLIASRVSSYHAAYGSIAIERHGDHPPSDGHPGSMS